MAFPLAVTAIGAFASLAGSAMAAIGTIAGAKGQAAGLQYQAQVAKVKGVQAEASAQRQKLEQDRKTQVVQSRLQAVAAASGAGASDPTVVDLATNIAGRGEYNGMLDMWNGQMQAWNYNAEAAADQASASSINAAAPFSAGGTLLGGVGSAFKAFAPYIPT